MGDEPALPADERIQLAQPVPVRVDREPRNPPDQFAQQVDHRPDVEDLDAQAFRPQLDDLQPGAARRRGFRIRVPPAVALLRQRPEEVLDQLEPALRADVLGEVGAARPQHPGDLLPVHRHGMAAGDQVEGLVRERQGRLIGMRDDDRAEGMQQPGRRRDVRRPGFGGHHRRRQRGGGCEDLPSSGLDVERGPRIRQPVGEHPRVAPARPFLGRPALQPGEVPPGQGGRLGFGDQFVERAHHRSVSPSRLAVSPYHGASGTWCDSDAMR